MSRILPNPDPGDLGRPSVISGTIAERPHISDPRATLNVASRSGGHPFVWTRTAVEILNKANRMKTSNPRH